MGGGRVLQPPQVAAQQLEHRACNHAARGKQGAPTEPAMATGPDDQQRAGKTAEHEQPMQVLGQAQMCPGPSQSAENSNFDPASATRKVVKNTVCESVFRFIARRNFRKYGPPHE